MRLWLGRNDLRGRFHARGRVFLAVFCIVLVTRLPFISYGYGYDDDGWRIMNTARMLAQSGEYRPSRPPGFPVVEFIYSFVWDKPTEYVGLLTALMTSIGIGVLGATLVGLSIPNVVLLCLAVACTPVVYVASTTSMDYLWALTFLFFGFALTIRRHGFLAGLAVGVAAGCRFTSCLMVIPFGLLLWHTQKANSKLGSFLGFLAAVSFTTALVYLPLILTHGPPAEDPQLVGRWDAVFKASVGVWGIIGSLALMVAAVLTLVQFLRCSGNRPQIHSSRLTNLLLIASGTAIALYAAVFAHYPFESAYLIPAVPFVFIVVSLVMPKGVTVALCALVIVSSFLFGVSRIGNPEGVEASPVHLRLTTAGEDMLVDVLQGPVLLDLQRRRKTQELLERLYLFADTTRQKTVVMVQWFFPQIEFEHGGLTRGGFVVFVGGLAEHDIEVYKRKGYEIRYLQRMDVTHFRSYGVDLVSSGAKELRLLPQKDLK